MKDCVVFVGSFTRDIIDDTYTIGGPPYYGSIALVYYGCDTIVVISPVEEDHIRFARSMGLELIITGSSVPVFELKYISDTDREVRLLRRGSTINIPSELLESFSKSLIIVNPVYREVNLELLRILRNYASILAIDIQGFVRTVDDKGSISIKWTSDVYEVIGLADIYHLDLYEIPICNSIEEAVRYLTEYSKGIVLVSHGEEGLVASIDGELIYVPALPGISGNSTGAGDILLSITAYEIYKGTEPLKAIAMGSVAAGLKVSRSKPPWFNRFEVEIIAEKLVKSSKRIS
ncbi:MAG TPA: hypothetical protein EYH40_02275 [Desulfurococcales archaeon]|nr:hypothetical protein [Desulfurococcales archaeon]